MADAVLGLLGVGAVGIALAQDLELGERLAGRRLVAGRVANLVEIGGGTFPAVGSADPCSG